MKKLVLLLFSVFMVFSASAAVKTIYVNPMQNSARADDVISKRLYKKALLGLTKAKTIAVSSGTNELKPGSADALKYDYILTIDLSGAKTEEAGTIGNLLGALSSSGNKKPDWEGRLTTDIVIVNATTGDEVFKTTIIPTATNKDKSLALFNATNNYDYDLTDMTDDAFRVGGEVVESYEINKKNIVKKVRVQVGAKDGARKNQAYELYKVVGDNKELIGMAKCEQVLSDYESVLSISGKKEADKVVSDLIQNRDGSYTIEAWSRSRAGFLHNNFQGVDKMFTKEGRAHYMDPFGRTSKPRIAFLAVAINDRNFSAQKENFENLVVQGMRKVPTINLASEIYQSVDAARNAGIDGLVEITIDKVFNTTEKDKEGKTKYNTEVLYTIAGIDVNENKWIDMKSFSDLGSSSESASKSNADALSLVDDRVQKFSEDLFPVAASVLIVEEVNKNSAKKVRIDAGTDMGVASGMAFDIYEQRADGGDDSRFLLGTGKVEKNGLTANEAILKFKGKDNGDVKLNTLMQNADDKTKIVCISKASYNILDKGLNLLGGK